MLDEGYKTFLDTGLSFASDHTIKYDNNIVLKVDGGVTLNSLCMQIQADVLGVPVSRPVVPETTALGAAYAAGLSVGYWSSTDELRENWQEDTRWKPQWDDDRRTAGYAQWKKAVQRTLDWVEVETDR